MQPKTFDLNQAYDDIAGESITAVETGPSDDERPPLTDDSYEAGGVEVIDPGALQSDPVPASDNAPGGGNGGHPGGGNSSTVLKEGTAPLPNKKPLWPDPVALSGLGDEADQASWVWAGYIAREAITLISGLPKCGKTRLIVDLLKTLGGGGDLGGKIEAAKVLIISEEGQGLWVRRRDDYAIADHVSVICRPFLARPNFRAWISFLEHVGMVVKRDHYDLVVLDTIGSLWPCHDENDASQVTASLMPLHNLTRAGAGVLVVHHIKKTDGGEGTGARGSTALPAFCDVLVELRRYEPENAEDRRRTLTALSRYDETPHQLVLELTDTGYRCIGSKSDAKQSDRWAVVIEILSTEGPGQTIDEIRGAWPEVEVAKPAARTLRADFAKWGEHGRVTSTGAGSRGNPHRFRLADSITARSCSYKPSSNSEALDDRVIGAVGGNNG
jgi:hypothetical protein